MKLRPSLMIVGALAVLAPLAACGSSKASTSESASSAAAPETTAASSGGSDAAYCEKVKQYKAEADASEPALQTNDPAKIRDAFESTLGAVKDLDKDAPSAIAADVHTVRLLADKLVSTLKKYDYDIAKVSASPEFATLAKEMDSPDLNAANDRLDKWGQDVCGIAPDSPSGS